MTPEELSERRLAQLRRLLDDTQNFFESYRKEVGTAPACRANALELKVLRNTSGEPYGFDAARPSATTLISDLFATRGARGAGIFRYYSSIEHSSLHGLLQLYERTDEQPEGYDPHPDLTPMAPPLTVATIEAAVRGAIVGYVDAFARLVALTGWNRS